MHEEHPTTPTDPGVPRRPDGSPLQVAERFVLERPIARGGSAGVFLARDLWRNAPVALKILRPPRGVPERAFDLAFRNEAKALSALSHPRVVEVHGWGRLPDGRAWIALDYVEGPRLTDLLRHGPMEPLRAVELCLQIADAVRAVHARGIVHRDLKPANILVRRNRWGREDVVLVDFGLATLDEGPRVPRVRTAVGSPHTMAPEQVRGEPGDARIDVYALGVVLFRMLAGRYPFHGSTGPQTLRAHLVDPIPSVRHAVPDTALPPELDELVHRCLEKDPERRYPDVPSLVADLEVVAEVLLGDTTSPFDTMDFPATAPGIPAGTPVPDHAHVDPSPAPPAPLPLLLWVSVGLALVLALLGGGIGLAVWSGMQADDAPVLHPIDHVVHPRW